VNPPPQLNAGTGGFRRRAGDYSRWFRDEISDDELADAAATIGGDGTLSASESRARIVEAGRERYTAPVSAGAAA
jgi:hypothetical protein